MTSASLRKLEISPLPLPVAWSAIPPRLIVEFGFIQHGWATLMHGPEVFIAILHAIGVPWPHVPGWATIVVELTGGTLILFGALVPATVRTSGGRVMRPTC